MCKGSDKRRSFESYPKHGGRLGPYCRNSSDDCRSLLSGLRIHLPVLARHGKDWIGCGSVDSDDHLGHPYLYHDRSSRKCRLQDARGQQLNTLI